MTNLQQEFIDHVIGDIKPILQNSSEFFFVEKPILCSGGFFYFKIDEGEDITNTTSRYVTSKLSEVKCIIKTFSVEACYLAAADMEHSYGYAVPFDVREFVEKTRSILDIMAGKVHPEFDLKPITIERTSQGWPSLSIYLPTKNHPVVIKFLKTLFENKYWDFEYESSPYKDNSVMQFLAMPDIRMIEKEIESFFIKHNTNLP